jgi:hypothetical protein
MKKKAKVQYRKINFRASENRTGKNIALHPDLVAGLKRIAKEEKKSVSWLVETALADYFGVEVMLQKFKTNPLPALRISDNFRVIHGKKRA